MAETFVVPLLSCLIFTAETFPGNRGHLQLHLAQDPELPSERGRPHNCSLHAQTMAKIKSPPFHMPSD